MVFKKNPISLPWTKHLMQVVFFFSLFSCHFTQPVHSLCQKPSCPFSTNKPRRDNLHGLLLNSYPFFRGQFMCQLLSEALCNPYLDTEFIPLTYHIISSLFDFILTGSLERQYCEFLEISMKEGKMKSKITRLFTSL